MNDELQEPSIPDDNQDALPTVNEGFRVRDEQSANWMVRKITESRRYADRVRAWAAKEIRRAEREEHFLLDRFGRDLEAWCLQQTAADGERRRSVDLPAGRIGFRTGRRTLNVINDATLLTWCRTSLPDAIQITERVAKSTIQSFFEATGELPPGTELVAGCNRFYVERPSSG